MCVKLGDVGGEVVIILFIFNLDVDLDIFSKNFVRPEINFPKIYCNFRIKRWLQCPIKYFE